MFVYVYIHVYMHMYVYACVKYVYVHVWVYVHIHRNPTSGQNPVFDILGPNIDNYKISTWKFSWGKNFSPHTKFDA